MEFSNFGSVVSIDLIGPAPPRVGGFQSGLLYVDDALDFKRALDKEIHALDARGTWHNASGFFLLFHLLMAPILCATSGLELR
jgi:hypothetical protein